MSVRAMPGCEVRVAPRASLLVNGALSLVFVSVALFGSLYYLAVPLGTWPAVLAIHVLTTLVFIAAWLRYRGTYVGVIDGRLEYRGFLRSTWAVPITSVSSVTIVRTYRPNSPDTSAQLLLRDAKGGPVLRMRGLFWHERDMRAIADALGHELTIRPDPMTTTEFLAAYPGNAFWFEGRPVILVPGIVVFLAIAFGTLLGLMLLTGIALD